MKKFLHSTSLAIALLALAAQNAQAQVVGKIVPPGTIVKDATQTGTFISTIVKFIIVIAGIWSLWQFLTAGFAYITSNGEKGKVTEATNKITNALTGLVVIGASFILIAIVSQLLFGDYTYILNPKLQTL